jgi:hypothetical protein
MGAVKPGQAALFEVIAMKMHGYCLSLLFAVMVGLIACKPEVPKNGVPKAPSASGNPATDAAGQAIVDSIKTPLDKAHSVEGTLEKAADKTADTVKGATP